MTRPPAPPLSGWFLLVLLVSGVVCLAVRAARNDRPWRVRTGVALGTFFALALPSVATGVTQDLTCRDGGVLDRPNGAVIVVVATALSLLWLLGMFWMAGDRAPGSGRRLAVIPPALLVPVVLVELMGPALALEDYCDGVHGVLLLQATLALLIPVAALALALVGDGAPASTGSGLPAPLAVVTLVLVVAAQAVALVDRLSPAPLACTARVTLPAIDGITGPDTRVGAADFDGNGTVDLAVFDRSRSGHVVANDGAGRFTDTAGAPAPTGFSPHGAVVAGDVDGNGRVDLVVAGSEVQADRNQRRRAGVAVLLNDGKTFRATEPLYLDGENPYLAVQVGDLDGDRSAEIAVGFGGAVVVLAVANGRLELGPRLLAPAPADGEKLGSRAFALVDVDGDGRLDVVAFVSGTLRTPSYVVVHHNAGNRRFSSTVAATLDDQSLGGVAVADFDGDGDVDLVSNGPRERLVVLVNRGDGRFDVTDRSRRLGAEKLSTADADGDGRADLILSIGFVSDEVEELGFLYVRLNRGGFAFSDAQRLATPRTLLAVADLNGDGRADYVVDELRSRDVLLSRDC